MPHPSLRHLVLCVDESGSMDSIKSDAEGGLRAFLRTQQDVPGMTTVTLWQFDHQVRQVFDALPLDQIPEFGLRPRGRTALLDAVGQALTQLEEHLAAVPAAWRPDEIVVVIVTDGRENASQEFTLPVIRQMIADGQDKGWRFVYVTADLDAFTTAAQMGIGRDTVLEMDRDATSESLTSTGHMLARGSRTGHYGFTDDERGNAT